MAKATTTDRVADDAGDHCEDSLNMVEGVGDDHCEDVLDMVREGGQ